MTKELTDNDGDDGGNFGRQERRWRKLRIVATATEKASDNDSGNDNESCG